jgi:hypothetical protein
MTPNLAPEPVKIKRASKFAPEYLRQPGISRKLSGPFWIVTRRGRNWITVPMFRIGAASIGEVA